MSEAIRSVNRLLDERNDSKSIGEEIWLPCLPAMEDAPVAKRCQVSLTNAYSRTWYMAVSVRTYDTPTPTLGDHLLGCVLVAQHYTARVHHHLLVERCHRSCTIEK
jgi:hypothetical protein